ncbi:ABC transporter substrate-binding protein [Methylobacterium terricola]|uniref:ABC transporter substrate-binding protein n=1 Tax=Methylobacterium terricola TaxID=2583531 RepID=A0A5C4L6K5_9HYPH|nr:ABC transporter substrate-binding protein [Methylobacterium terricola]TNC06640.1 ABC transporter substrate-binding protein [Methylobacterium terricola]
MLHTLRAFLLGVPLVLSAPAALAQKVVTVGWGSYSMDAPQVLVASEKGYFKEAGIAPKLIPFQSGREGFEALIGGQLDVTVMAEFPAVVGTLRKQPFAVLAVLSRFVANRLITTPASGATDLAGLSGKKIGLPVGTNVQFMVDEDLKRAGVKAQIVNLTPPDLPPALLRGDVDAIATFPGAFGGARRILGERYRELPVSAYATTFVVAASRDFLAKDPATTAKLVEALVRADEVMKSDPAGAQDIVAKAAGKALTLEGIRADWDKYRYGVVLDGGLIDLMVREGTWIRERGIVRDTEPSAALFRSAVADAPLKSVAPATVTLP